MKKKALLICLLVFVLASSVFAAQNFESIHGMFSGYRIVRIIVDGREIKGDVPGIIVEGRTMVPVRFIVDALGGQIEWDESTFTVNIETTVEGEEVKNYDPETEPRGEVSEDEETEIEPEGEVCENEKQEMLFDWFQKGMKGEWTLTYEVTFAKGSHKADVVIHINDPLDEVRWIHLQERVPWCEHPPGHITNIRAINSEVVRGEGDNDIWIVEGSGVYKLSYTIDINAKRRWGCAMSRYASFASCNWIVACADVLFLPFASRGSGGAPQDLRLIVNAPEGWNVHVPYPEISPGVFNLDGLISHPLAIRDFIVVGNPKSLDVAKRHVKGTYYKVVAVETDRVDAEEILNYIINLSAIYSDVILDRPPAIMTVTAPEPMRRWGGEGKCVSMFVSDNNPFPFDATWGSNTWGHELIHIYQRNWYMGDIYWLGQDGMPFFYQWYGPLRAGYITAEEFLDVMINAIGASANKSAILSEHQCIAFKGSLVTLALDIQIRQDSNGKYSFNDAFRILNNEYVYECVTPESLLRVLKQLTGRCYDSFFEKYIRGSDFPHEILDSASPELYE